MYVLLQSFCFKPERHMERFAPEIWLMAVVLETRFMRCSHNLSRTKAHTDHVPVIDVILKLDGSRIMTLVVISFETSPRCHCA